ncbi:MAG: hypothetical protein ACI9R3_001815 [Verrucomicrobiales bacterium]|jgi:hypothetical protein
MKITHLPLLFVSQIASTVLAELPRLKVSGDQRYLQMAEGKPFFWLGDTVWELFHRLDRKEADLYLEVRSKNPFCDDMRRLIGSNSGQAKN